MNLSALQHSVFLQSLGWAIINSLWQAALLYIVAQLVLMLNKNGSAQFRSNVSTGILLSIFGWFTYTFIHKYLLLSSFYSASIVSPSGASVSSKYDWVTTIEKAISTLPFLSLAYLLLLPVFTIRLIWAYRNLQFIRQNGLEKPPAAWKIFMQSAALQIGIDKKIRIWLSEHVDVPATIGFFKPLILLPLATINNLTTEQVEAIILHELSHIRRNDYLLNIVIVSIETVLFFNPFVVLISRTIKKERENCCDDLVMQYQYDRHAYASALLSLEQKRHHNLRLSIAATSGKKQLMRRVQRIMEGTSTGDINYGQKILALLFITAIMCSIQWITISKRAIKENKVAVVESKVHHVDQLHIDSPIIIQPDKQHLPAHIKIITRVERAVDNGFADRDESVIPEVMGKVLTDNMNVNEATDLSPSNHLKLMFDSFQNKSFNARQMMLQFKKLQSFEEKARAFKLQSFQRFRSPINRNRVKSEEKIIADSLLIISQHDHHIKDNTPFGNEFAYNFDRIFAKDSIIKNLLRSLHSTTNLRSRIKILISNKASGFNLNSINVDVRDGIVYLNGKAITSEYPDPAAFQSNKRFFMFSNGDQHVEINMTKPD